MKKFVLLFIILTFATKNYSQDTLLMKDGTRIICEINQDNDEKISFSFIANNREINSIVDKKEVNQIKYKATNFD